jgi:hypothetical protein
VKVDEIGEVPFRLGVIDAACDQFLQSRGELPAKYFSWKRQNARKRARYSHNAPLL